MQKTAPQASILMWTVFLSMILAMTFLSISTQIHNTIKNSGDFVHAIDTQNEINTLLAQAQQSQVYEDKDLDYNITINFENQHNISRSLQNKASTQIQLLAPLVDPNDIIIRLSSGGPVIYEYRTSDNSILESGLVLNTDLSSGNFGATQTGSLFLKNIGAHAQMNIQSSDALLLPPETHYSIYRKVGNLNNLQTKGTVGNFSPLNF